MFNKKQFVNNVKSIWRLCPDWLKPVRVFTIAFVIAYLLFKLIILFMPDKVLESTLGEIPPWLIINEYNQPAGIYDIQDSLDYFQGVTNE